MIIFVDSLNGLNASDFLADIFILPNGEVYQVINEDQLGGIGSFFKKIGEVALNVGGSFVGVGGLGTSLLGGSGEEKYAAYMPQLEQIATETQAIITKAENLQITGGEAHAQLTKIEEFWQQYKFSVKEKDQGWMYQQELQYFAPAWKKARARFDELTAQAAQVQTLQGSNSSTNVLGSSTTILIIGAVGVFLLMR